MSDDVQQVVHRVVLEIAQQRKSTLTAVSGEQLLAAELGFDSLDYAQLVSMLEIQLGWDPFSETRIQNIRTVAELCDVYRGAGGVEAVSRRGEDGRGGADEHQDRGAGGAG